MIAYRPYTVDDVINEVVIRMGRLRSGLNIDWATLRRYTNRAVKEVMATTLAYKDWAYITQLAVTNGTVLPVSLLKPVRVIVSANGLAPFTEARRIDAREFFSITDTGKRHSWNRDLSFSPVYALWGNINTNPTQYVIYIAPTTYSGTMDAHVSPADLVNRTDVIPIPYEFRTLVILGVLSRVFAKYKDVQILGDIMQQLNNARASVMQRYAEKRRTEGRELDSFVEPAIPYIQPQPEQGEVQQQL